MSVWFMGYTPNLATAAMIAGANSLGHWITLNGQTIGGAYTDVAHGSTTAGPMWYDAMSEIQNWLPDATFTPPNGQDVNGVLTTVPDVAGLPYDQAAQQLTQAGFQVADGGYRNSGYAADTVAYTNPGAGSQIASGTVITIYRSERHAVRPADATTAATTAAATATGPGNGPRATGTGTTATGDGPSTLEPRSGPELAAYLRGDGAAVGAAPHLRRERRPSPCPWPACPRRRRRSGRSRR